MSILSTIAEPLALGLSTGTWCAMYCGPVLIPFLCGKENPSLGKNASLVGLFLCGRLATYAALGFALGAAGFLAAGLFDPAFGRRLSTVAYMLCGATLLAGALLPAKLAPGGSCAGSDAHKPGRQGAVKRAVLAPFADERVTALLSGLCVGLHVCPPFWTAAARSLAAGSPAAGGAYFALFYAGTIPFFLPLLGIPFFTARLPDFRKIARITQVLVGVYFLVLVGLIPFFLGR